MEAGCEDCPVLKTALFRSLSHEQITRLGCIFRLGRYRRNQILYFEGGVAHHLFALHAGLLKVVKSLEGGKDRIVAVLLPGELFGLEALTENTYPLTAITLRDSEICAASREEFVAMLQSNPDTALGMVRFLVSELARLRAQVTDMSFKDARMKVATFLLSLLCPHGPEDNANLSLTLPLSRQEISEVLELSPETVSRTLSAFRREQLVVARGRHLVIQDRARLQAVAHR
jgi:CRP/FNR family transcriptional regulator